MGIQPLYKKKNITKQSKTKKSEKMFHLRQHGSKQSFRIRENFQTTVNSTLLYRILVSLVLFFRIHFTSLLLIQLFQSYVLSLSLCDLIVSEPLKEVICFSADLCCRSSQCVYRWFLSNYNLFTVPWLKCKKKRCTIRKRNSYQECKGHERPIFSAAKKHLLTYFVVQIAA